MAGGDRIGDGERDFPLPLAIRNDVVHQRDDEIGSTVGETLPLKHRTRRHHEFHGDAVCRKEAAVLRHPDRPIEAARENIDADDCPARSRVGGIIGDH
jgi:hypothetical protein